MKKSMLTKLFFGVFVLFICLNEKILCEQDEDEYEYELVNILNENDTDTTIPPGLIEGGDQDFQNLSSKCQQDIGNVLFSFGLKKMWAQKFFDSFGRPSSGNFEVPTKFPGSFKECRAVEAPKDKNGKVSFRGKYCDGVFTTKAPKKIQIVIGLCIPDSCDKRAASFFMKLLIKSLPALYQAYLKETLKSGKYTCHPNEDHWDARGIIGLVICSLFGFVMLMATLYDYYRKYQAERETSEDKMGIVNEALDEPHKSDIIDVEFKNETSGNTCTAKLKKLLLSFSVLTNASKILTVGESPAGNISCMHGIRFLSMSWVIFGHVYVFGYGVMGKVGRLKDLRDDFAFQINTVGGTLSVDTFFLLSGSLVGYLFLRQMDKIKSVKLFPWLKFYFHRFWRLTPPYMLIMGVYICLFPHLGSGPFWRQEGVEKDYCVNTWWTNLLYVNNLVRSKEMCMAWTWYLANDMQFYVISPLYLIPLALFPLIGVGVIVTLLVLSWILTYVVMEQNNLTDQFTTTFTNLLENGKFFDDYYIKPYTRIGPYLIGILLGYAIYKSNFKAKINKWLVLLGWIAATGICLSVVYSLYHRELRGAEVNAYVILSRSAWAVGVAWVIFACSNGYGGVVNSILSWKALVPLSRLTYCAYLIHPVIMYYAYMSRDSPLEVSQQVLVIYYLGYMLFAYGVAFVLSLAFEAPMISIEKILLQPKKH